jgi:hypothetical protein
MTDIADQRERATHWAQGVAVLVLIAGIGLVGTDIYRTGITPVGPAETTTTTKETKETRTTSKGPEATERHEVTTALKETSVERALGPPGLLFMRLLLVLLVSFFTGAAVQRVLLGEFSLKLGPVEVPPIPPPPPEDLAKVPDFIVAAFGAAEATTVGVEPDLPAVGVPVADSLGGSGIASLFAQIDPSGLSDFAVINLGEGRNWLTSRLFLFAVLLRRMRRLRAFVFVETRDGISDQFLGIAEPAFVRWRLARAYPWLEAALARAYGRIDGLTIRSDAGALDPNSAGLLVENFMNQPEIRSRRREDSEEWLQLIPEASEHAVWINRTLLDRLFDLAPARSSVVDAGDLTERQRTLAVLACQGAFVALIDDRRRFRSLIDRDRLLNSMAQRLAAADGAGNDDRSEPAANP